LNIGVEKKKSILHINFTILVKEMFSGLCAFQTVVQMLLFSEKCKVTNLALFLRIFMNITKSLILFSFNNDLCDFRMMSWFLIFHNLNTTEALYKQFPKSLFLYLKVNITRWEFQL